MRRVLTALVLLPLLYLFISRLPSGYFLLLVAILGALAMGEFLHMYHRGWAESIAGALAGGLMLLALAQGPPMGIGAATALATVLLLWRLLSNPPQQALKDLAPWAVGLLYIPLMLTWQVKLREAGPQWVLLLYATVWSGDTLALYAGTLLGRHSLYSRVSPKKTVEGALGSLAGGAAAALVLEALLGTALGYPRAAFLGLLMGAAAVGGDLVESMFKRDAGVKDSSRLIPGHGGLLDKLDGSLLAGPLLYGLLRLLGAL
jgi:phosphatidate cytidylyltransferase